MLYSPSSVGLTTHFRVHRTRSFGLPVAAPQVIPYAPVVTTEKRTETKTVSFHSSEVAEVFAVVPEAPRERLLELRSLIFEVAQNTPQVGTIEETLRWGEPSYIPSETKSGTTLRIHWKARNPEYCALYVPCQTTLLDSFRTLHKEVPEQPLVFEGRRAVLFLTNAPFPRSALADCIRLTLTYRCD